MNQKLRSEPDRASKKQFHASNLDSARSRPEEQDAGLGVLLGLDFDGVHVATQPWTTGLTSADPAGAFTSSEGQRGEL